VSVTATILPGSLTADYTTFIRARLDKSNTKERHLKNYSAAAPADGTMNTAQPMASTKLLEAEAKDRAHRRRDKRVRMDPDTLRDKVYESFDKAKGGHSHWKLADLVQRLGQPQAYLKEVLSEVCDFNKSGEHINTWSLKVEHQLGDDLVSTAPVPTPVVSAPISNTVSLRLR